MSDDIIDVQVVEEQIVACPGCGRRNRIHMREREVGYRCGACRTNLPNPFAAKPAYPKLVSAVVRRFRSSRRGIALVFCASLVLLVLRVAFFSADTKTQTHRLPSPALTPLKVDAIPTNDAARSQYPPPTRSLTNGTVLSEFSGLGSGTLTIDNGTAHDAVVKVVDERARHPVVVFYVCAGSTATIEHIPDGDFRVIFAVGTDWDSAARTFTRDKSFAKFDEQLAFVTSERPRGDDVYKDTPCSL